MGAVESEDHQINPRVPWRAHQFREEGDELHAHDRHVQSGSHHADRAGDCGPVVVPALGADVSDSTNASSMPIAEVHCDSLAIGNNQVWTSLLDQTMQLQSAMEGLIIDYG